MPFPVFMLSIIYPLLLPRHSLPSFSVYVISLHSFSKSHTPLFTPTCQQNCSIFVRFAQFPSPFCYSQHHSYRHTLRSILPLNKFPIVKLFFPRRFLLSTLLTTQTKLLPLSHKLSSILLQLYNFRHFHLNHHSSSTFAIIRPTYIRIHSTFIICNLLIYY